MLLPSLDVVWLGQLWATQALSIYGSPDFLLRWRCLLFLMVMFVSITGISGSACLNLCPLAEVVLFDCVILRHLPWVGCYMFPISVRFHLLPLPLLLRWCFLLWRCLGFLQSSHPWLFPPLALWVYAIVSSPYSTCWGWAVGLSLVDSDLSPPRYCWRF